MAGRAGRRGNLEALIAGPFEDNLGARLPDRIGPDREFQALAVVRGVERNTLPIDSSKAITRAFVVFSRSIALGFPSHFVSPLDCSPASGD